MATPRNQEHDEKAGTGVLSIIQKAYDFYSFNVEAFRAWCFNPLRYLIRKVVPVVKSIIYPTSPVENKFIKKDSNEVEPVRHYLRDSPISFYDPFDVVNGVPVFHFNRKRASASIQSEDPSNRDMESDLSQGASIASTQRESSVQEASVYEEEAYITACAFTEYGERFVTCYASGQFIIWDTNHGGAICENNEYTGSQILAVTFLETSKADVFMMARNGTYLRWDVEQNIVSDGGTILEAWTRIKHLKKHIKLHTVDFYSNGRLVVCTSIIDSDTSCQIEVFIAKVAVFPFFQDVVNLSEAVKRGTIICGVELSPDKKGIIVGTSDSNMQTGLCFLWPSFAESNEHCRVLYPGTLGTWSANNELAVTWTVRDGPKPEANNGSSAFVWNVKELRENIKLTHYRFKAKTLKKKTFGDKVLWCRLVSDSEGNDRLIMAIIGTTTRFLFWDVESSNHTHTIETGILARDMMLASTQSWIDSRVNKMSVKGLNPMAVTTDRSKFGAVLGSPCQVFIYDALLGVQSLKLDPYDSEGSYLGNHVDIIFSSKNGKIAAIGAHSVMMFAPPTSSRTPQCNGSTMETSMIELDNSKDRSNDSGKCKLAFSGDGKALGILTIGSCEMQVYHLETDSTTPIKTNQILGEEIMNFCLSMDGRSIVTSTKHGDMFVWKCLHGERPIMGTVSANLDPIALGISPDAKEIVVCSLEGALVWLTLFEFEPQVERKDFLSARFPKKKKFGSAVFVRPGNVHGKGSTSVLLNHANTLGGNRDLDRERPGFTYNLSHECVGFGVVSCRISADCSTAVRLLQHGQIELWTLKEKCKELVLSFDFPATLKLDNQDLLPLSGHATSLELLGSRCETNGISSIDQVTTVLPEKEGFLVTDNVDPSLRSLLSDVKAEWFTPGYMRYEDLDSLFIVNTNSPEHSRRLRGRQLKPQKGLAISADGRYVACLSGKYASKIILWNIYASEDLLPDYHSFSLLYSIKNKLLVRTKIQDQLNSFGANFFNFKHPSGLTLLTEATLNLNNDLLEIIFEYGKKNEVKVSFLMPRDSKHKDTPCHYHNAVEACLYKRSPEIVKLIMHYLLNRLTHEAELDSILTRSLTDVESLYGPIFDDVIHNTALFQTVCKFEVPTTMFGHREFITATSPFLILTENEMKKFWNKEFEQTPKRESVSKTTAAMTFQFKDACQIGERGLLRGLLLNEADYSICGSFAVRAIVDFKMYARTFFLQEFFHHFLIVVAFTTYCFLLLKENTFELKQDCDPLQKSSKLDCTSFPKGPILQTNCTVLYEEDTFLLDCIEEDPDNILLLHCVHEQGCSGSDNKHSGEEPSVPEIITLVICWLLSVPSLLREVNQCIVYTAKHHLSGFVFWLKSGWNWMEVLSYFNIVIVIPLAHFVFANEGDATTKLSAFVAVELLLLWSRMLFYARPFQSTGPLVITISLIFVETAYFLFLALCVMFGFALAFRILYRHVEIPEQDESMRSLNDDNDDDPLSSMHQAFGTFKRSLFTVFGYTFGGFNVKILYNAPEPITALTLFVVYVVTLAIILLNMIITLMNEKFSRIQENQEALFTEARARAIDDIDSMLSTRRKEMLREENKGYLQVLIPDSDRKRLMEATAASETRASSQSDDLNTKASNTEKFSGMFLERLQTLQPLFRGDTSERLPQSQANPDFEAEQDLDHSSPSGILPRQSHTGRGMRRA
eukprot:g6295.t1